MNLSSGDVDQRIWKDPNVICKPRTLVSDTATPENKLQKAEHGARTSAVNGSTGSIPHFRAALNLRGSSMRSPRQKCSKLYATLPLVAMGVFMFLSLPPSASAQPVGNGVISPTVPPPSPPTDSPVISAAVTPSPTSALRPSDALSPMPSISLTSRPAMLPTFPPTTTFGPSSLPTFSSKPTETPTESPAPTPMPSRYPSNTGYPSEIPSIFLSAMPSETPSIGPSMPPTLSELSFASSHLLQSFTVGNGRIFNDTEQAYFQQVMRNVTYIISQEGEASMIKTSCKIEAQRLLVTPQRRTLRLRMLQGSTGSSITTNQVEYAMKWTSWRVNVTNYTSLFSRYIDSNLDILTLDLQTGGLDVFNSSTLATVLTTTVPTSVPSTSPSPSSSPSRSPTLRQSVSPTEFPSWHPSGFPTREPSIGLGPSKIPSNQGAAGTDTNTAVIASVMTLLVLLSAIGGYVFYRRRKQLKEQELQAATAAAGRMPSESHNSDGQLDRLGMLSVNTGDPHGGGPLSDENQGILSPNESLQSNPSLISAGMSLGDGSVDEADRTHHLADEFDQYKDQNLEKVRNDVEEAVNGSDGMMSQAMTRALMDVDDPLSATPEISWGATANSAEIEASALCEVNDFLKRKEDAGLDERRDFMQETMNKMVACVRHGIVEPDDASRTIHESAAMLGLELAAEIPENTVIVTGLRKNVTKAHLEAAFIEFGDIEEAAVASDARGFGLVRFLSPQSAHRTMNKFREGEIVVQDVAVMVKVLKSDGGYPATGNSVE